MTIFPYTVDYRKKLNTMNVFLIVVSRFFFYEGETMGDAIHLLKQF